MKKIIILTCFLFFASPAHVFSQNWVRVSDKSIEGRVTELDRNSIIKYQGIVALKARNRAEKRESGSYTFYDHIFVFCKSREVWDISSTLTFDDSDEEPSYEVTPSLYGPTSRESNHRASNHPLVLEGCKRANSKVSLEIPISRSSKELYFLLPAETRVTGDLVSLWIKEYPITKKTYNKDDGTPIIFRGEPLTIMQIVKNSGYSIGNWVSNCLDDTSAVAALHKYGNDGVNKDSTSIPRKNWEFTTNVPESIGKRIHDVACALR
jgi:hypothetical protein